MPDTHLGPIKPSPIQPVNNCKQRKGETCAEVGTDLESDDLLKLEMGHQGECAAGSDAGVPIWKGPKTIWKIQRGLCDRSTTRERHKSLILRRIRNPGQRGPRRDRIVR